MKPQRKRSGRPSASGSSKFEIAAPYCALMPGRRRERGLEAVAALIAVEPVLLAGVGHDPMRLGAGLHHEALRFLDAALALLRREIAAALADRARRRASSRAGTRRSARGRRARRSRRRRTRGRRGTPRCCRGPRRSRAGSGARDRAARGAAGRRGSRPAARARPRRGRAGSRSSRSPTARASRTARRGWGRSRGSRPEARGCRRRVRSSGRLASCCTRQRKSAYGSQPEVAQRLQRRAGTRGPCARSITSCSSALIGRRGSSSSARPGNITFLCP